MKYIVIEGRMPQDGSKAQQALILFPKWMSPTLVCAGITGRVIEMTDGSVIDTGDTLMTEEQVFAGLVIGDLAQEAGAPEEFPEPPTVEMPPQTATDAAQQRDDAYREGMQAMRTKLAELLLPFGMPTDAKVPNWLKEQLEELAKLQAQLKAFEGGATRQAYDETLAKLQAAEDNLDAWRDAAGAAGLGQECEVESGRIKRLFVVTDNASDDLNTLCAAYGCLPGQDRLSWLQTKLNALIEVEADLHEANSAADDQDRQIRDLHEALSKIRKLAKNALK
jgi:hypothetical protein